MSLIDPIVKAYNKWLRPTLYLLKLRVYLYNVPKKVASMRGKECINVLFVVTGIRGWKALPLFVRMMEHHRFNPLVGVNTNPKYPESKVELLDFLLSHHYEYIDLDNENNTIESINPDLIIYDSPYVTGYSHNVSYNHHLNYLFCGCDYCLAITNHKAHMVQSWYDYCWQFYVEHNDVAKRKKELLGWRASNIRVTGVPIQDELKLSKENFADPWKDKTGKKRIIYAPHHSFKGVNGGGIEFATFMDFCDVMIEFAKKYQDKITISFKPHPFLYIRLLDIWGKERTDAYYRKWEEMPNTQFENGAYYGLFKYSDAIIHDCASFIVEYLYMNKPSLYLVAESNHIEDMFDFVKDCYNSHEHAFKSNEIESFINNVIKGVDNKKEQRLECIKKHLTPPNDLSACDNIIKSILND